MRIAFFSAKSYDQEFFNDANKKFGHEIVYFESRMRPETVALASEFPAVCAFVNDDLRAEVLIRLVRGQTRQIALRCSGFNNVDLFAAHDLGITVTHVPSYSPHAVAEHAVALILTLNRKMYRSYGRVRDNNLSLEGLLGFDINGLTVGVVGTGRIGAIFAQIMKGFGCKILAYDVYPNPAVEALGAEYTTLNDLFSRADIISLHCPLTPDTRHLINAESVALMKRGVMLINTSRGPLIDTSAVVRAMKTGKIGYLGLDVYEEEADLFYQDLSDQGIQDDIFARLITLPNVVVTGHQAFFTSNALRNIAETTLTNITAWEKGEPSGNEITEERVAAKV